MMPRRPLTVTSGLAKDLGVLPITASLLINRGHSTVGDARSFLHPDLKSIPNPFLLPDMDRGTKIVTDAIANNRSIGIYGDYDVDGLSGAAIIARFLREIGIEARIYIPHRLDEGYGLHLSALKTLRDEGTDVLITVDTGATAISEIEAAKKLGLEIVVTDHHQMGREPSDDLCIINPARPDSNFGEDYLSGSAVAFLFAVALRQKLRDKNMLSASPHLGRMINLAALGVIADIVPMIGTNRILAKYGLRGLADAHQPGVRELVRACGVQGTVNESCVSFRLAPRINAAGRMGEVDAALNLLMTDDESNARELAAKLSQLNSARQREEEKLLADAVKLASPQKDAGAIVVWGDGWHQGIIGIVASRLANKFERPSAVISFNGAIGRGSIRGISGGNVVSALSEVSDLLDAYGGHSQAAGLSIKKDKLDGFIERFTRICARVPKPQGDDGAEIEALPGELNEQFAHELSLMCPFGPGNPEPTILVRRKVLDKKIVAERHLKLWIDDAGSRQEAIAFGMANMIDEIKNKVAFIATPRPNYYRDNLKLELVIKNFL